MTIDDPEALAALNAAFDRYEVALMENDIAVLDELFRQAPETIRYGVGENLYGFDEIAAFRQGRPGGSPQREVLRRAVTIYGQDFGTTNIEFRRIGASRIGRQSQSWARIDGRWQIVAAHVSMMGDTH